MGIVSMGVRYICIHVCIQILLHMNMYFMCACILSALISIVRICCISMCFFMLYDKCILCMHIYSV